MINKLLAGGEEMQEEKPDPALCRVTILLLNI